MGPHSQNPGSKINKEGGGLISAAYRCVSSLSVLLGELRHSLRCRNAGHARTVIIRRVSVSYFVLS